MSDILIAAVVGAITGLGTSLLGFLIAYRNLKTEFQGKFRLELISKQLVACESLWALLALASRSDGIERVITYDGEKPFLVRIQAKKLYDELNIIFNSPFGLYYSKNIRKCLFDLRDFIHREFLQRGDDDISKVKVAKFDGYVQNLRIAIRKEIGVEDLKVTEQGPVE